MERFPTLSRSSASSDFPLVVVHSFPVWLPLTQSWMHQQVRFLPENVEAHIVCERTENLGQFALEHVHSLEDEPRWRSLPDRAARHLNLRRHLGFLVSQIRQRGAQVLHSHFGNIGWANLGAARRARVPHVVTFYGYDMSLLPAQDPCWRERYRELFRQVDRVLCEGPYMAMRVGELGCPREKLRVHALGVDVEKIRFEPRHWSSREPLRVLIAATFQEKKGIPYALQAVARLRERASAEVHVTIIGDANEEPRTRAEKQRILSVIEHEGLAAHVRLLGFQPAERLFEEAYRHHVFLSPSVTASDGDEEGGAPVTLIEMAATGMPVVSTDHADIPQVVRHGVTGLLSPPRDVEALVENLHCLMAAPESWRAMTTAARRHVENDFDARRQAATLANLYWETVGKSSSAP